ncbi:MAG: hypothetical protein M3Q52_08805 [Pseudomonadota bacterium]|nr:hypothetical protein [Pseudomonadota bacterium]
MLAEQTEARPFILLEAGASALLGLALGAAALASTHNAYGAAAAGLAGAVLAFLGLDRVAGAVAFRIQPFKAAAFDLPDELVLNLDQRIGTADELLLDDALAAPAADARVIQLFATAPLPTAGELQARIERHLGARPAPESLEPLRLVGDDSDALHEALAALRHSLR